MGIGEPVRFEPRNQQVPDNLPRKTYQRFPAVSHFGNLRRFLIVLLGIILAIPLIMFSPFIILGFISDWRVGLAFLALMVFITIPIIFAVALGVIISYFMLSKNDGENFVLLGKDDLIVKFRPGRHLQPHEIFVHLSNIKQIEIDKDVIERQLRSGKKNFLQILYKTPLPPVEGFYSALSNIENLVIIRFHQKIRVFKITPGLKWVAQPEEQWIDEIIFNVEEDRKWEFKQQLEKCIRER